MFQYFDNADRIKILFYIISFYAHEMMNNYISVIVTAYNRKEFLLDALKSAVNQTLDRKYYEIIVVKNFKDEGMDEYITQQSMKNIYTEDTSLSGKIVLGLKTSSGNIVSFLDDDDIFLQTKLEHVRKAFLGSPDLIYYHNNFKIISNTLEVGDSQNLNSSNSKEVRITDGKAWHTYYAKERELAFNGTEYAKISKKIKDQRADFNNSCISVKREVILSFLKFIKKMESLSVDQVLFYLCLQSGHGILIDRTVLSLYRIHESNSSLTHSIQSKTDKSKITMISYPEFERKRLIDLNSLIKVSELFPEFRLLNVSSVQDYIRSDIALIKISQCLRSTEEYYQDEISYRDYIYYMKGGKIIRRFTGALVCFFKLKSKTFNKFYLKFRTVY